MKKSVLQLIIGVVGIAITMLTFIGTNIRHFSLLTAWLTYTTAAYITGTALVLVSVTLFLLRFRAIAWMGRNGERLRIKKLNNSIYSGIGLLVLACWATAIVNAQSRAPVNIASKTPPFDTTVKDSRILIMPFMKTCTEQGRSIDIGDAIRERLEKLRKTDSLHIQIRYFEDPFNFKNFTPDSALALMKRTGATDILYGSYSMRECDGGTLNRLCFNHRTDYKKQHEETELLDNEYKVLKFDSVDDIREGTGLSSMDDMIYFVAGLADYRSRKYRSAIARYEKIQGHQQNAPLLFDIGNCHLHLREKEQARRAYQLSFQADPTYGEALTHISWLEMAEQRYDNARRLLETAQKADPDNLCSNKTLGGLYLKLKDTVRAKACFQNMVRTEPKNDALLIRVAKTYLSLRDYPTAVNLLENAYAIHPGHPGILNMLGKAHFMLGNFEEATSCFEYSVEIDCRDARAWNNLGVLHRMNKRYKRAIECFVRSTDYDPKPQDPWIAIAECYVELQQDQDAFSTLQEALSQDRKAEKILNYAAALYNARGQYQNAGFHYLALTNLRPSHTGYQLQLAMCYYAQSDYKSALYWYRKVHLLQPANALVLYKMACVSSQLNDPSHVVEYLSKAVRLKPELMQTAAGELAFKRLATDKNFSGLLKNDSLGTKSYIETPACYLPLLSPGLGIFGKSPANRQALL